MFSKKAVKKKPAADPTLGAEWFTLRSAAAAFDVSSQAFHKIYRPLIPPADVRQIGRANEVRIRLRGVIDAWVDRQVQKKKLVLPDDDEEKSAALERLRAANADMAEDARDAGRKLLIPSEEIRGEVLAFAAMIHRATEVLQRQFGPAAAAIITTAVDEAEAKWTHGIPLAGDDEDSDRDDPQDAGPTPPDDAEIRRAGTGPADRAV